MRIVKLLLGVVLAIGWSLMLAIAPVWADDYTLKANPDRDGTGKVYMQREIAQVMGHQGAGWLERSTRVLEERPEKAIDLLGLKKTDTIADIGAGTGYFTFRIAHQVAKVYAVDVQPEMLAMMAKRQSENGIDNIERILGEPQDPHLPEGTIDLVLMADAYHEFEFPREMMQGIVRGLKPGGRVAQLEYKTENPLVLIKPLHKMTQGQVRRELESVGLEFVENRRGLPQQHLLIFRKPG
jgi:ubiquinone/menaquinone biosynthesis C-methylase UbiE